MNEKIVHRVRALLNLAQNGGDRDSNEAQTALLMAQRIMAEYGLEEIEVKDEAEDLQTKEVLDDYVTDFIRAGADQYMKTYRKDFLLHNGLLALLLRRVKREFVG